MGWKIDNFIEHSKIVFISNADIKNITGKYSLINNIKKYDFTKFGNKKITDVLKLVKLDENILLHKNYTDSEKKRLNLAFYLLNKSKVFVFDHFFKKLNKNEIKYFIRLFRELIYRKRISIVCLEDDLNIICEYAKGFYLFYNGDYHFVDNFYDESIYKYVKMPYTIKCIKFLENKGHVVDHEITFDETLKAIYRSVV